MNIEERKKRRPMRNGNVRGEPSSISIHPKISLAIASSAKIVFISKLKIKCVRGWCCYLAVNELEQLGK